MNGHLAGQSHVADDLSSIVEGIDETISPYRTICAAEVAQVLHLAVLPKEVVNLWRPRVCVNHVTWYKTFLQLDHGHSYIDQLSGPPSVPSSCISPCCHEIAWVCVKVGPLPKTQNRKRIRGSGK
jgi:hypothetical protein